MQRSQPVHALQERAGLHSSHSAQSHCPGAQKSGHVGGPWGYGRRHSQQNSWPQTPPVGMRAGHVMWWQPWLRRCWIGAPQRGHGLDVRRMNAAASLLAAAAR